MVQTSVCANKNCRGSIILETAVEGEKDVQDIDVHGRFEKLVVTL
jgi:hypothetical protein